MTNEEAIKKAENQLSQFIYIAETSPHPGIAKINSNKAEWLCRVLHYARKGLRDQEERKNPKRLTVEELTERDDPVWVSCKTLEGTDGYWCLCNKGVIICPSGQCFDVRDIPHWMFYGGRVELCSKS